MLESVVVCMYITCVTVKITPGAAGIDPVASIVATDTFVLSAVQKTST
jgi:hypothetical protein